MDDHQRKPIHAAADADDQMGVAEFAARFRTVHRRLWLIAAGILGDRTEAEDVVQDAAVIALRKLDAFRPGSNFSAWLAEIVRRCAANRNKKSRNRSTSSADPQLLDHASAAKPVPPPTVGPTGELLEHQGDFDDDILRALHKLNSQARACLLLRTVAELSYAEIAELVGVREGTAMSHVHRGKTALRRHLEHVASRKAGERK